MARKGPDAETKHEAKTHTKTLETEGMTKQQRTTRWEAHPHTRNSKKQKRMAIITFQTGTELRTTPLDEFSITPVFVVSGSTVHNRNPQDCDWRKPETFVSESHYVKTNLLENFVSEYCYVKTDLLESYLGFANPLVAEKEPSV